ncbi:MAG: hypothetical protein M3032_01650 [Verrucomicrobiota bacterium]|nr:hypothetical protein [Verrucomicrobiota bacterium]
MKRILAITLLTLACAAQAFSGGVTIITHGFAGNVTDWIIPMAGKIGGYPGFPGVNYSCYEISITRNGSGQYVAAASLIGGVPPAQTDSGEIVVKLDWSTLSSNGTSTTTVAQTAVNAVLSSTLLPELGGRSLGELPLHFIGHSRGGSVMTEMARLLGAQGVWVDHVSTLDPRPVAQFGDAAVTSWANVLYADNFWQTMGDGLFTPNGQSVFGAYNRKLLDLNGGYTSTHSDVHLWYHGTIDLATPASDTQATITATQRNTWWTSPETFGAGAGFVFSLIGGGDRLSNLEPAGIGNGRINDGFNRFWNIGCGIAANRTALSTNAGSWPNPIRFLRNDASTIEPGGSFDATLYYQTGSTAAGQIAADVFLDPDANPYNGNEIAAGQWALAKSGTNAVLVQMLAPSVNALTPAGTYFVGARLSDNGHTRYLYAPQRVNVSASTQAPSIDASSLAVNAGGARFDVHARPGQTVIVLASTDLKTWTPLASRTFDTSVWQFSDTNAGSFARRFYRASLAGAP